MVSIYVSLNTPGLEALEVRMADSMNKSTVSNINSLQLIIGALVKAVVGVIVTTTSNDQASFIKVGSVVLLHET